MKCCIKTCANGVENFNVTFHKFPLDEQLKSSWINILGISELDINEHSVVCSEHFLKHDVTYDTQTGEWRIKEGAHPALVVCRICLAVGISMYSMAEQKLRHLYENVTGIDLEPDDHLPKMFCWECTARLKSANRFKEKATSAYELLSMLAEKDTNLSIEDIRLINPEQYKLKSTLIMQYATDQYDLVVEDYLVNPDIIKQECKVEFESMDDVALDLLANQDVNRSKNTSKTSENKTENVRKTRSSNEHKTDNSRKVNDRLENNKRPEANNIGVVFECVDDSEMKPNYFNENDTFSYSSGSESASSESSQEKKRKSRRLKTKKVERTRRGVKVEKKKGGKKGLRSRKQAGPVVHKNMSPTEIIDLYRNSQVVRRTGINESMFTITQLDFDEQIARVQKRQETEAYQKAPYKCTVCYRGFQLKATLDTHLVRHSESQGQFECFICKHRFNSARFLRRHITAMHTEQYTCKECNFVTRAKATAAEHQKWHLGIKYRCPHCDEAFGKYTTYLSHVRLRHPSRFVCDQCGYTFVSSRGVLQHKNKRHPTLDESIRLEGPFCDTCEVRFASNDAYERHLVLSPVHNNPKNVKRIRNDPHRLNKPGGREFPPAPRKKRTEKAVEERTPITCEVCEEKVMGNRAYNSHIKTQHPGHNRTKYGEGVTSMCHICGKLFPSEALLKTHMSIHSGESKYKCTVCAKLLGNRVSLRQHLFIHSGVKHTCPHCQKSFNFQQNLHRHVTTVHGGVRRFQCSICSKRFASAAGRKEHVTHVHERKPRPKRVRARQPRELPALYLPQ